MNPFKWAKQKLASAFAKREYKAPQRAQHPAKAAATAVAKAAQAELVRRRRSPTMAQRRRLKWFHISAWPFKFMDPKTGEVSVKWAHKTYNVGRNKAKRAERKGLPGKSARRVRIGRKHFQLAI